MTVLLTPSYEEPVETAYDLIERDIIPFYVQGGEIFKQIFAASPDPNIQEISQRLVIAKDWYELQDMARELLETGMYATIGTVTPFARPKDYKDWYRSSETISGLNPYQTNLSNKKWPLRKVLYLSLLKSFPNFSLLET